MSTTYNVKAGDTFELISRRKYGVETNAALLQQVNPGSYEPLIAGTTLVIPNDPYSPQNVQAASPYTNIDETALLIDGERFRYWNELSITRQLETIDTVSFGAPFGSEIPGYKEAFRPLSYKGISVTIGGNPVFTGTMVNPTPNLQVNSKTMSVNGYSECGVLNDCCAPADLFPLEFIGLKLSEIAKQLCSPFGVSVEVGTDEGAVFKKVALEPEGKILSFLIGLASQQNVILTNSERGNLLITKPETVGSPCARLTQGNSPLINIVPQINPQGYFSHITGIAPTTTGEAGKPYTVKNKHLTGVMRPYTYKVSDTLSGSLKDAVSAKAGKMFASAVTYTANLATWRDPLGNLWEPGKTIKIEAPDAMIYNEYEFLIKTVTLKRTPNSATASLSLVLPGVYSGEIPEALPWDI